MYIHTYIYTYNIYIICIYNIYIHTYIYNIYIYIYVCIYYMYVCMLAARSGMNLNLNILVGNIKRCQMSNKALDMRVALRV